MHYPLYQIELPQQPESVAFVNGFLTRDFAGQGYSIVSLSTFRDIPWNAPFYSKLRFSPVDETELTTGFQQIRLKENAAGLSILDRVMMHRVL